MKILLNGEWQEFNKELFKKIKKNIRYIYYYNNIKINQHTKFEYICSCSKTTIITLKKINFDLLLCDKCKRKNTFKEKYGVENPAQIEQIKEKIKQTNLEKYGNVCSLHGSNQKQINQFFQNKYGNNSSLHGLNEEKIKNIKKEKYNNLNNYEKIKQTNLNKYGVINTYQIKEIHEKAMKNSQSFNAKKKAKKTCLEKYGVDHQWKNKDIHSKTIYNSNRIKFEKYYDLILYKFKHVIPLFKKSDYKGQCSKYKWKCTQCNKIFNDHFRNHIPKCPICYKRNVFISKSEIEILDWLKENFNTIHSQRKLIYPYELDIYLPDYNLAIEFNGLYWHSELQGKDKNYHLNKTLLCQEKGIHLLHVFEDEWLYKQEIVKSIIKSKLSIYNETIYARKCIVKEVENYKDFLENNHLQGYINSKINLGLYYNNELVSLLTFGKPRYNKNYDYEILRFCNLLNTRVIGGFAKLLKYFKNKYLGSIITYSDKRYFDGSIYRNNGFTELKSSGPNYYYTDYKLKYNRIKFQKHKLSTLLENFNPNLTEWENMQLNGWDRIWDCGNYIFIKKLIY